MTARDVKSIPRPKIHDEHTIQMSGEYVDSTTASQEPKETQNDISNQHRSPSLHLLSRENRNIYLNTCVVLYKAALKGDWRTAKYLLAKDPRSMLCASITNGYETVLHIAAGAGQTGFVEELLKLMESEDLTLQDQNGNSAFCFAAAAGATKIARIMLEKNKNLLTIRGGKNMMPIYMAALFAQSEMASFLYNKTIDILQIEDIHSLFFTCVDTGLYDLALKLLEDHPKLAVARDMSKETALHILAKQPSAFDHRNAELLKGLVNSFPGIKFNHNKDLMSTQALQLVKRLWEEIVKRDDSEVRELISKPSQLLLDAAKLGNFEFLAELIRSYPDLVHELDDNNHSIFHIAVLHRHTNIFNLIYEIGFSKELILTYEDCDHNNILHLAAKFPHQIQVSTVSGAAIQMQREKQWFKEIEMMVQPSFRGKKNSKGETPSELFTLEHKVLLEKGELWMKNTAQSCMIVATLIATIMFTAAFSVPDGNDNNRGLPVHLRKTLFQVFAISDAITLSSSSISILMFLSILTSRYSEDDFLKSLPFKLMMGLSMLVISIITMMVAFSTTFILAYHDRLNWVTMLTTGLASVPVALFVLLQYPLMRDLFCSTYHPMSLFKRSKYMIS